MHRLGAALVALAIVAGACGGASDEAAPTSTPEGATATPVPSPTPAPTDTPSPTETPGEPDDGGDTGSGFFSSLGEGDCFDDPAGGAELDLSQPASVVDCALPHDNEVTAIIDLGSAAEPFPGADELEGLVVGACTDSSIDFLGGRDFEDFALDGYYVWPDEPDWDDGVRSAVCAVFGSSKLVGTARSGGLDAAPSRAAVISEDGGVVDVWLLDTKFGDLLENLTDDAAQEVLNPVDWAPDGRRIAYGSTDGDDILVIDIESGDPPVRLVEGDDKATAPDFSPDGNSLLYVSDRGGTGDLDIFVLDLATGTSTALTDHPDRESSPEYSPDGSSVVFRGRRDGNSDIYVMNADGSDVVRLTDDPAFDGDPTWTPDGQHIVFISDRTGNYDIYIMGTDGSGVTNLTNHPADDEYPAVVPSGDRVAFHSNRLGGTHVWVVALDGSDSSLLTAYGPSGYIAFAPAP